MQRQLPLPVHSYSNNSRPVGTERLVNCFAEQAPPEGKAPTALLGVPGAIAAVTPGTGVGRGLYAWNGSLFAVHGSALYSISSTHAATSLGGISGSGIVSWAINPTQMVICAAPDAYYTNGAALTQITDADYTSRGGASSASIDGYILFREPNTGRFFSSDLNNAAAYDALMFATAEGFSDNLVGMLVDHRQVFLAGSSSIELWYNNGGSGFPFLRDSNGFIEIGCAAGDTLCKVDNSVLWLASDLTVRRLDGATPVRISQHGVEQAIRTYVTSDAQAFTYTHDGHILYVLNFPTSGHTWVYDATTREWHERESYGLTRWRPMSAAFCYGRNYVQDYETGSISYLDADTYTEFGTTPRTSFTFGTAAYANGGRVFHQSLEFMCQTGVGLTSGQGVAPLIMLDISNDGGRTWRALPNKSLGALGNYRTRVRYEKLGSSRDRIYRASISDPIRRVVSDASLVVSTF